MSRFYITRKCMECGACKMKCPKRCIKSGSPFYILDEKCDDCGICYEICPYKLIEKREENNYHILYNVKCME